MNPERRTLYNESGKCEVGRKRSRVLKKVVREKEEKLDAYRSWLRMSADCCEKQDPVRQDAALCLAIQLDGGDGVKGK